MSEQRKYRSWTAQQKIEIVLAGLRGDRSVKEVCREHEISETLYYAGATSCWRAAGGARRQGGAQRREGAAPEDPRARAGAGSQDLRARDRGGSIARLGVSERVARSRELVAEGSPLAAVARVLQVSRQAIYRDPTAASGAGAAQAPAGRCGRGGDRRGRRGEPDRRLPDRDRLCCAQARVGGQPQAGAAGDAGAQADPAPPQSTAPQAARGSSGSSGPGSCGSST